MKFERTFIFVAVLALAVIGYGITGAFILEPEKKAECENKCGQIVAENVDACLLNGTYYKKDFFMKNICLPDHLDECEKQLCGVAVNIQPEKLQECIKLCEK